MKRSRLDKYKEEILRMYHIEGWSAESIADMYKLTGQSVINWLKQNSDEPLRAPGPIKTKITEDDEETWPNERFDKLTDKDSLTNRGSSEKGEIYDDMMTAVLEQLQDGTISKPEALKRYLHIEEEFDDLGKEDFEVKYRTLYPELANE